MAVTRIAGYRLYDALKEQGFELVPNSGDVTLEMPVDGPLVLVQREMLTGDRLAQVGRALQRMAEAHSDSESRVARAMGDRGMTP